MLYYISFLPELFKLFRETPDISKKAYSELVLPTDLHVGMVFDFKGIF